MRQCTEFIVPDSVTPPAKQRRPRMSRVVGATTLGFHRNTDIHLHRGRGRSHDGGPRSRCRRRDAGRRGPRRTWRWSRRGHAVRSGYRSACIAEKVPSAHRQRAGRRHPAAGERAGGRRGPGARSCGARSRCTNVTRVDELLEPARPHFHPGRGGRTGLCRKVHNILYGSFMAPNPRAAWVLAMWTTV